MIVDGPDPEVPGHFLARGHADAPDIDCMVRVKGKNLRPGDLVRVKVTAADGYDLAGPRRRSAAVNEWKTNHRVTENTENGTPSRQRATTAARRWSSLNDFSVFSSSGFSVTLWFVFSKCRWFMFRAPPEPPFRIGLHAPRNAGKTCFFACLYGLRHLFHDQVLFDDDATLAYLKSVWKYIKDGQVPPATAMTRPTQLAWQLNAGGESCAPGQLRLPRRASGTIRRWHDQRVACRGPRLVPLLLRAAGPRR